MSHACRRNKVTKRGTSLHRGQGSGGGGGGGGDDRRNYRKPLPEDAYTNWMEDELARIIERILERADARFLANMPPYPDGSINTLNTNKWMNWLHHLLDGHLERHCGLNYNDKSLVNDLYDECVKSSAWLDVMNILELVAKVVRKVMCDPLSAARRFPQVWPGPRVNCGWLSVLGARFQLLVKRWLSAGGTGAMLRAWRRDCTSRAVTWPWRGGSDDEERDGQVLVHVTTTGTTALRAIDCQKKTTRSLSWAA